MSTSTDWDWGVRTGTNPNPILRIRLEFISGILLFSPVLRTALYSESILLPVTVWMIISLSTLSFYCLSSAPFPLAYTYVQILHIWKCLWCSHCLSITELFSTSIHFKEFPTVPSTSPWLTFTKHNQPAFFLHHWETTLVKTKFSSTLRQRTKGIVFNCEEKRNHKVKGQSSASVFLSPARSLQLLPPPSQRCLSPSCHDAGILFLIPLWFVHGFLSWVCLTVILHLLTCFIKIFPWEEYPRASDTMSRCQAFPPVPV